MRLLFGNLCLVTLCALGVGEVSTSSALGATTGYTCVAGSGAANTNADCESSSTGTSGHVAVAANTPTTLTVNKVTNWTLGGKIFGANVELTASGVDCVGCQAESREVGGVMEAFGPEGKLRFTPGHRSRRRS
jgi:hypothetical protein